MQSDIGTNGEGASRRAPVTDAPQRSGAPIDRAVDAAQQVVVDQLGLARLELTRAIVDAFGRVTVVALGIIAIAGGWAVLLMAAHRLLETVVSPLASFALLAAGSAVVGVLTLAAGVGRLGRATEQPEASRGGR